MYNLTIINKSGKLLADSREVAEMVERQHSNLMRDIHGYKEIIDENSNLNSQDFFIPDTYRVEGNNKTYDCYLLTRKGCDMVANKMTGEKGVLFTAVYVTKFEQMEGLVQSNKMLNVMSSEMETFLNSIVADKLDAIEDKCSQYYRPLAKEKQNIISYIKKRLGVDKANEEYELVKQRVLIKLGGEKWEDIPVEELKNSLNMIDESIRIIKADRKNNQVSLWD